MEEGAALVRIFSDQQECASWYLYLRPDETFVVFDRAPDLETDLPASDRVDDESDHVFLDATFFWCADSFEEFAYRYWVENRLWRALHEETANLTPDLSDYLAHYQRRI